MSVGQTSDRKDRPAYVRFERVSIEDKAATIRDKQYRARDVDMALITAPYTRDTFKQEVPDWLAQVEQDARNERIPPDWPELYRKAYEAWQRGEELPPNGTPIKGWGVISPAQQDILIRMHVLTVEDCAQMNDEGLRRFGMGAMEVRNKADAWLKQTNDKGPLTIEMAAIKSQNASLLSEVETLKRQVAELVSALKTNASVNNPAPAAEIISAADLLDEDPTPAYIKKFGKPPHHRMTRETIRKHVEGT